MNTYNIVFGVIGDPHFKVDNEPETSEMHEAIVGSMKELKPNAIVVLGDILHTHEKGHVNPHERAENFLLDLSDIAPLYVIIGNHDRPNNSDFLSSHHYFTALKRCPNITVADTTIEVMISGQRFIFVPYVPAGEFIQALEKVTDFKSCRGIFAHQEFRGAKMGGIISEIGDEWTTDYPFVISGHIHDYDQLQCNIIYTGTPIQHAYGDRDDKTISKFVFAHESKYPSHDRINLNLTRKKIIKMRTSEVPFYHPPDNYMIKIIAQGTPEENKSMLKSNAIQHLLTNRRVKIVPQDITPNDFVEKSQVVKNMSYLERLFDAIKDDDQLKELYERYLITNKV